MADLILYLGVTAIGYALGSKLRNKKESLTWTGKIQTVSLMLLVLCMGMRMGANKEITENLSTIGLSAFLMTIVIVVFSVVAVFLVRKLLKMDKYGRLTSANKAASADENIKADAVQTAEDNEKKQGVDTMTIVIIISVAIGMLIGYFVIRGAFADNMAVFESVAGWCIKIGLCILLVFVGIDLGVEGTIVENFKTVGFRVFAIPLAVIVGTLGGALVMSAFLDISAKEAMAIGAGFGWYTLAPGIIMEAGYMTASAICFLHNVMRELVAIIFIPIVAKKIGYLETIGLPASPAMDVCLPIVEKATRSDIAVYSFISGAILSTLVPILVPIIIGL